jgi:hypothetical protein
MKPPEDPGPDRPIEGLPIPLADTDLRLPFGATCHGCGLPIPDGAERIVWTSTAIDPDVAVHDEMWHPGCAPQVSPEEFILGRMPGCSWAPINVTPVRAEPAPKRQIGSYLDRRQIP